jgi:Predicted permeases
MSNEILAALLDTLLDTLKILPFLFLSYLLIEYIEHKASKKMLLSLSRFGRFSPLVGAAAGVVPQCGFSVASAKLYSGRLISFGTMAAVFIATSDEAIPVLLAHPESYGYIWQLIIIKFVIAVIAGFIIDTLFKTKITAKSLSDAHEHIHKDCGHSECQHGIFKPALKHTLKSVLFVFLVLAAVNIAVAVVGEDAIASIFPQNAILQPLVAVLVGFIPNCASSIILAELFAQGVITFGSFLAGLVTNAGIAYLVLFRSNKDLNRNITIVVIITVLAMLSGYVIQLF